MPWGYHEWPVTKKETKGMTKTESNAMTEPDWDVSFWFAVLSPVLGILAGLLTLFFFYH